MNLKTSTYRSATAVLCSFLIAGGDSISFAQNAGPAATAASIRIPNEQLDSLVAPIALFPDPLLAQVLAASTYPLEIVELSQWLQKNKNLSPNDVAQAAQQQPWDPSVQAMAVFPDIVKDMAVNVKWTDDLGNAFLAQQSDVMDAVQRMRIKAKNAGKLQTNSQQTVNTEVAGDRTVVVIEPANPDVVYVPMYDPAAVWGAAAYPYPPVYYPPGYAVAAGVIGFGVGVAIGAAWGGSGWGWHPGWHGNNVIINNNNAFINHYNRNRAGNRYAGGGGQWQHNPAHRGGAPYGDRATAQRFGGTAPGASALSRQNAARQNVTRGQAGANRPGAGAAAGGSGAANRAVGAGAGAGGIGAANRAAGAGGAIGSANRAMPPAARPSGGQNVFGGAGTGGRNAGMSSQRGRTSMGGGGFHGGGFRGGGMRGGGRRR